MKIKTTYLFLIPLLLVMLAGCGHQTGNNPLGVTGGGEGGYGNFESGSSGGGGNNGGQHDPGLFGSWRYDAGSTEYEIITFNSNGTFVREFYLDNTLYLTISGTYSTSGDQITFVIFGQSGTGTYSISGNDLTITIEGDTTVYHRV